MKENKRSIITNIKIMIVALVVFIPLEFHMYSDYFAIWFYETFPINAIYLKDFVKVIFSGVFTGAFVTCLVNRKFKQLFSADKPKLTKATLIKHIIEIQNLLFKEENLEDLMAV